MGAGWSAAVLLGGLLAPGLAAAQQDPLAAYVQEGLASNLELRQQRLLQSRAEAAEAQSRGQYLPSVTLGARYSEASGVLNLGDLVNPAYAALNRLTGSAAFPTNISASLPYRQETMLHLVQPVFHPAIYYGHKLQQSLTELETSRTGSASRRVVAQVRTGYLNYARATQVVELYRTMLPVLDENVRVNERLVANGKATAEVVLRAKAERGAMAQQLMDAERQRDAAREYFAFLLNRPLDSAIELVPDSLFETPLPVTLEQALASARSGREELAQADLGVSAARAQKGLARSAFLPAVSLAVDYGFQGQSYQLDSRHDVTIASLVLQWNLFNGGQDAARRTESALDAARAETRREEASRLVALEADQAWRAAAVGWEAIATARERLAAARRSFELVHRRYEEGVASQLEFMDARAAYTAAALNEILSRYDYATRRVELERAAALDSLP